MLNCENARFGFSQALLDFFSQFFKVFLRLFGSRFLLRFRLVFILVIVFLFFLLFFFHFQNSHVFLLLRDGLVRLEVQINVENAIQKIIGEVLLADLIDLFGKFFQNDQFKGQKIFVGVIQNGPSIRGKESYLRHCQVIFSRVSFLEDNFVQILVRISLA